MSKRLQVIDSARDLFRERGYRDVSMDEIARTSGVTKRTIYRYFEDKNDLIRFFLYEELDQMRMCLVDLDSEDIPFGLKIRKTIDILIDYRMNSRLMNDFYSKRVNISDECIGILENAFLEEISFKLKCAIDDGYIKNCDVDITAFIIYKVCIALIFEWNKPFDRDSVTNKVMNILETGLFR